MTAGRTTRAHVLRGGAAVAFAAAVAPGVAAAAPSGKPETTDVRIGIPLDATSYLPLYVALAQNLWKAQGLNATLFAFRGDAESSQALAGDSIDVNVGSLTGLINLIQAGQPAIGFYGGSIWPDSRGMPKRT